MTGGAIAASQNGVFHVLHVPAMYAGEAAVRKYAGWRAANAAAVPANATHSATNAMRPRRGPKERRGAIREALRSSVRSDAFCAPE